MSAHPDSLQLQLYLDGELPGADSGRVEAHCAGCAECAHAVDELRKLRNLVGETSRVMKGPEPIRPWLARELSGGPEPRFGPAFALASAAACAIGIAVGVLMGSSGPGAVSGTGTTSGQDVSIGSLWSRGGGGSLLDVYVQGAAPDGETGQ
jgi:anti-sigma factor RsiW